MLRRATTGFCTLLTASIALAQPPLPVRLYLPMDGSVQPDIAEANCAPAVRGRGELQFAPGIRGQALVLTGGTPGVSYPGESAFDVRQGTIAFWVQAVDWDSSQELGANFFRLGSNAFLYRYAPWADSMSFYCKWPRYGRNHILYTSRLRLPKGQWVHVTVTWLDRVLCLYADGKLMGAFQLWEPMTRKLHGEALSFGTYGKTRTLLDEVYVLDYPLAAPEVAALAASGRDGGPAAIPKAASARLHVVHYPEMAKADVYVHIRDAALGPKAATARVSAAVDGGKPVAIGQIALAGNDRPHALLPLGKDVPAGQVVISAELLDAAGKTLTRVAAQPFEKRIYPWMEAANDLDPGLEVLPPFTPLKFSGQRTIQCWGREYRFGPDGLPAEIVTRDKQVLAKPVTLAGKADGQPLPALQIPRIPGMSFVDGAASFSAQGTGKTIAVRLAALMEYDGTVIYDLSAAPAAGAKATELQEIYLDIPVKDEHAVLYHACRDQIRSTNEAGFVPKGEGKVWGSSARKSGEVLGTFLPYLWLGDYDRGLCWMADNDRGWSVGDDQDCVELIREGGTLLARVHFVRKPTRIEGTWGVKFALQAGPPRPQPKGWRLGWGLQKTRYSWYSHERSCQGYGRPPDPNGWRKYAEWYKKYFGVAWGLNTSPNDFWLIPGTTEENEYFQLEWRPGYPTLLRNNFVASVVDQYMAEGLVAGLYSDDTYPQSTANLITGTGYVRPDGMLQAGYSMFALRDFYKRLKAVHVHRGGKAGLLLHMTDAMIMPAYCFWDDKHDNEWGRRIADRSWIEAFPLAEIAARCMARQYGMAASWHTTTQGHGDDLGTLLLLHDIVGRVESMQDRTLAAKIAFGLNEDDVEHVGYWTLQAAGAPECEGIKVSAWRRSSQGTALIVVGNLTKQPWTGEVSFPAGPISLADGATLADGEPGHWPRMDAGVAGGRVRVKLSVAPENYRIILAGPADKVPAEQPALGSQLPRPVKTLAALCDSFDRAEPGKAWRVVGDANADPNLSIYRGRLCVEGRNYRFACAERDFGQDDVTVQVRMEDHCTLYQETGLGLVWPNGMIVTVSPRWPEKRFAYHVWSPGAKYPKRGFGGAIDANVPGADQSRIVWLRVRLTKDTLHFAGSTDGRAWTGEWSCPRDAKLAGPPIKLRLGKNPAGRSEHHLLNVAYTYFDNLVVGRE